MQCDMAKIVKMVATGVAVGALLVGCDSKGSHPRQLPDSEPVIDVGGRTVDLIAGRRSLWVLTCDRRCTRQPRPSVGRLVRLDPQSGRRLASARLRGASRLAIGAAGIFVIDFWRNTIRRLDPGTLGVKDKLALALPFELIPGDSAFLPFDIAATRDAVWVSTARGVLTRIDPRLSRVVANVRVPFEATGEISATEGEVWIAEQLAGLYRVDPGSNSVVAKIRVGNRNRRLAINQVLLGGDEVFAVGGRTRHDVAGSGNALVRVDPRSNRVKSVTPLPRGPLAVAYGKGTLWAGRIGGRSIEGVNPTTGEVEARLSTSAGTWLAVSEGELWTVSLDGVVRRIATP